MCAQPGGEPVDELTALYDAAKADIAAKRYPLALEKCRVGLSTPNIPAPRRWSFLVGLGLAYEGMQRSADAVLYYHQLLAELAVAGDAAPAVWKKRERQIGAFAAKLQARVAEERAVVVVTSTPPGARVRVDGSFYGPVGDAKTPALLVLSPGEHAIQLEMEDYEVRSVDVRLARGSAEPYGGPHRQDKYRLSLG